ncbi:MAG: hypothetical protein AB3N18_18510 [Allomuricauda sp.]
MNTKRLFFGVLAVAFLAMTAVSTNVIEVEKDQTVKIDRKKLIKL